MLRIPAMLMAIALVSTACAMKERRVLRSLQNPPPVDCSTAPDDIRTLESEKASVEERVGDGASAVVPTAAALAILTGTEGTKIAVADGHYNQAIDKRIAQIKQECGIS